MTAFFLLFFFVVLAMFVFNITKGFLEWNRNNQQPILHVVAKVVSKRHHTSHHTHNMNGTIHSHNDTEYFATFEVESGDRIEFKLSGREYGLLAQNDSGRLTFQGTRYLGFERTTRF